MSDLELCVHVYCHLAVRGKQEAFTCDRCEHWTHRNLIQCRTTYLNISQSEPFGQAPLLHDGTFQLAQSNAILRYLARKHDLMGDSLEDQARADMINDSIEDLRVLYVKLIYQNYEAGKGEYTKALPSKLKPFETLLKEWGKQFILDKITFVDYNLLDLLDIHLTLAPGCLDDFPTLKNYYKNILERPRIQAYRQSEGFKQRPINYNNKE